MSLGIRLACTKQGCQIGQTSLPHFSRGNSGLVLRGARVSRSSSILTTWPLSHGRWWQSLLVCLPDRGSRQVPLRGFPKPTCGDCWRVCSQGHTGLPRRAVGSCNHLISMSQAGLYQKGRAGCGGTVLRHMGTVSTVRSVRVGGSLILDGPELPAATPHSPLERIRGVSQHTNLNKKQGSQRGQGPFGERLVVWWGQKLGLGTALGWRAHPCHRSPESYRECSVFPQALAVGQTSF